MVGAARTVPQRFRVVVVRYPGEMDFQINNAANNGFDQETQTAHMPRVGQSWHDMPFMRNQVQILYDRTYTIDKTATFQQGVRCAFNVKIQKKMTYETTSTGATAVGAGNIFLGIISDDGFTVRDYYLTALYKQL